jgi:protein SCO1
MNPHFKKRLKRIGIIAAAALAIGAGIGWVEVQNQNVNQNARVTSKPVPGIKIGGPFSLIDQNGNIVTNESFPDQHKLIYFGFTYCPAICPTELAKITKVMKELDQDDVYIKPIFITIDPERDTPKVLKDYLTMFDPEITGLTGTREQIDDVLKKYKIYAAKTQEPEMDEYTMDHSSFIYLIDTNSDLLSIYRIQDTAENMLADIRSKVGPEDRN